MLDDNLLAAYARRLTRLELPEHLETMQEYLDFILPKIGSHSEHLGHLDVYTNGKYWLEVKDDDNAHETILHMFGHSESPKPIDGGGNYSDYKYSVDGNMMKGSWSRMGNSTMMIKALGHEMYNLAFLNPDFMILKKHGNHKGPKYLFLANENKITRPYEWYDSLGRRRDRMRLEWRDIMEMLYDIYRFNKVFVTGMGIVVFFLIVLAFFSIR